MREDLCEEKQRLMLEINTFLPSFVPTTSEEVFVEKLLMRVVKFLEEVR